MKAGWTPWEDWTDRTRNSFAFQQAKTLKNLERFWKNGLYTVQQFTKDSDWGPVIHLLVRRNDEGAVHSWADLQRIKDELVGPSRTAIEVYPARIELVDQANIYHLWVLPEGMRLPFGLHFRGSLA